MTSDKADYILRYYSGLMTRAENRLLNKYHEYANYLYCIGEIKDDLPFLEKNAERIKNKFGLSDLEISQYASNSVLEVRYEIAVRIFEEHKDKILFNTCPVCGELARTPVSRQAKCGHRW